MEWNRRAEQGERGRRRAFVLEALPCSRRQHKVLRCHDANKIITLYVLTILNARRHEVAQLQKPSSAPQPIVSLTAPKVLSLPRCTAGQQLTSLAPQALNKSQSSAGFVEIVESAAGILNHRQLRRLIIRLRAPQVLMRSLGAPQVSQ